MRFAVDVPNFGDFADPRVVADLARRAPAGGPRPGGRTWNAAPMVRRADLGPPPW
jgi:hypothetical protein